MSLHKKAWLIIYAELISIDKISHDTVTRSKEKNTHPSLMLPNGELEVNHSI